jgi:diacylglycerol O-acyltransferase / wax synthase
MVTASFVGDSGGAMRQLTSLDAQFLALEDRHTYGHFAGLTLLEGTTAGGEPFTAQRVSQMLTERLHLLPPFRWRLVEVPFGLDHPYWVDDPEFDLEYHVREIAIPAPGDDRQLAEQVARIHSRPLDRSRPLWELYVIHNLAGGRVAMLTKIHHAAIDGMSGAEILSVVLDLEPEGRRLPPPAEEDGGRPQLPGGLELLGRGLANLPRQPLRSLGAAPRMIANLDTLPGIGSLPGTGVVARVSRRLAGLIPGVDAGEVLEMPHALPPRTVFNGPISGHRRVSFTSLSLDEVKEVKNRHGVTVNDVVVAIAAGAVRRWLLEHAELPDRPLTAMIPLSVRTPEEVGTFGNRISLMGVPIPTDEPDGLRRLQRTHEALRSAKERHRAVPASILQDLTQTIPPAVFARASRALLGLVSQAPVAPMWNLCISNVPGVPVPLYCAGARVLGEYPISTIAPGMGLNITVLSYQGRMDVGIVADREQMPDAWPLADGMRDELAELLASKQEERPRGRRGGKARRR